MGTKGVEAVKTPAAWMNCGAAAFVLAFASFFGKPHLCPQHSEQP